MTVFTDFVGNGASAARGAVCIREIHWTGGSTTRCRVDWLGSGVGRRRVGGRRTRTEKLGSIVQLDT